MCHAGVNQHKCIQGCTFHLSSMPLLFYPLKAKVQKAKNRQSNRNIVTMAIRGVGHSETNEHTIAVIHILTHSFPDLVLRPHVLVCQQS